MCSFFNLNLVPLKAILFFVFFYLLRRDWFLFCFVFLESLLCVELFLWIYLAEFTHCRCGVCYVHCMDKGPEHREVKEGDWRPHSWRVGGWDSPQPACSGAHPNLSILSVGVGKGRSGTFVTYACFCDLNTALKAQAPISVPAPKIILEHP